MKTPGPGGARCVAALVALLLVVLAPRASLAAPSTTHALALVPALDVHLAPLSPAGAEHPRGSVAVVWHEHDHGDDTQDLLLRVAELDLASGRLAGARTVRRLARAFDAGVQVVRSADALLILQFPVLDAGPVELVRLDLHLAERDHAVFSDGAMGSLVADERHLALATYEDGALHVRVLDHGTLAVVAARKLQGGGALTPWPSLAISAHALRLHGPSVFVALAAPHDTEVLRLGLASLATEASRVFALPPAARWHFTSGALASAPAPLSLEQPHGGRRLFAADLREIRTASPAPDLAGLDAPDFGERSSIVVEGRRVTSGLLGGRWVVRVSP